MKGCRRTQFSTEKKVLKGCAIQLGSLLFQTFQVSVPLDLQGKDQYGSIVNSFLSSSPYVLDFDSQCTFFRCFSSYQYWSTLSKLCFVVSSAWEPGSTTHISILINCNPDKEWSIVHRIVMPKIHFYVKNVLLESFNHLQNLWLLDTLDSGQHEDLWK